MKQAEYTYGPTTERGRARRNRIIAVATQLFYEHGFSATGIDDIGAAAGITGPGVYRHFAGKDEILIAVLDRIWMMLKEGIDKAATLEPAEALDLLVDTHVRLSVSHRAEFTLLIEDLRFLPEEYQALAASNRATYRDALASAMVAVHPTIPVEVARLATDAAWRLSSGSADAMSASGFADDELVRILSSMTRGAIVGVARSVGV